jgi:hypothetical protein
MCRKKLKSSPGPLVSADPGKPNPGRHCATQLSTLHTEAANLDTGVKEATTPMEAADLITKTTNG